MTETTSSSRTKIVLSLDVGTTTVKAILISKDGVILGRSHEKVKRKMLYEMFSELEKLVKIFFFILRYNDSIF